MMRHLYHTIAILLFLLLGSQAEAQPVKSLNRYNGLAGSTVLSFFKDSVGTMFFGTSMGLTQYTGHQLENTTFNGNENGGLAWVEAIEEVDEQTLLLGTKGGLFFYDKTNAEVEKAFVDQVNFEVSSMRKSAKGDIYIGTARGLFLLRDHQLSRVTLPGNHNSSIISHLSIVKDRKGGETLWMAFRRGVGCLGIEPKRKFKFYAFPKEYDPLGLLRVEACADGRVLAGSYTNGVFQLNPASGEWHPYMLQGMGIKDMDSDGKTYLLVATAVDGAYEVSLATNTIQRTYSSMDKPGNVHVRYNTPGVIYRDDLGLTWVGYTFFGVDYTTYLQPIFSNYALPGVFDSKGMQVRSFLIDGDRVLLGTRNGLYVTDRKARTARFVAPEVLGARIVSQVMRVGDTYLVGTIGGGIAAIDCNSLQRKAIAGEKLFRGSNIYKIAPDKEGNVWLASSAGMGRFDQTTKKLRQYSYSNSHLPSNEVFCFEFDDNGLGWISTMGGICCYDPASDEISTSDIPKGIVAMGRLIDIHNDRGRLLFLPQLGFPKIYHPGSGKLTEVKFPIYNDSPVSYFLAQVGPQSYIYATEGAIYRKSPKGFRKFAAIDGLDNQELQSRSIVLVGKQLWVATVDGLKVANLDRLLNDASPSASLIPTLIITNHLFTRAEMVKTQFNRRLQLSRENSDFSVQFSPMIYADAHGISYICRLKGHDDWHLIEGNSHAIVYRSLSPGDYTLEVKALGMPGISMTMDIDVPVTYATITWVVFILLVVLLVVHIAYCRKYKRPYIWDYIFRREERKYTGNPLDSKESRRVERELRVCMEEEKLYLDPNLQMSDLAKHLGCTPHTLTQVITQVMHTRYYDLIAEYRVKEFQRLASDPQYDVYTINALAEKCGFRSRTPFNTSFKKFTGMSPSEYVKQARAQH
jgi:ligand-binding sensor domain-containing protein/AraC-like DNA-binding protein